MKTKKKTIETKLQNLEREIFDYFEKMNAKSYFYNGHGIQIIYIIPPPPNIHTHTHKIMEKECYAAYKKKYICP